MEETSTAVDTTLVDRLRAEILRLREREEASVRLQDELRESRARYAGIVWNAVEGFMQVTPEGRYVSANPAAARMFGYDSPEDLIAETSEAAPHAGMSAERQAELAAALLEHETVQGFETTWRRRNGSLIWVSLTGRAARDANGGVRYYEGTVEDITERRRAEEAIEAERRRLTEILECLPDATMVVDASGTVIAWNPAMAELTGIAPGDMIGKGDQEYSIPFYGERRSILVDLVGAEPTEWEHLYPFVRRDGRRLWTETFLHALRDGRGAWVWAAAAPLLDDAGQGIGAVETIRDITEAKLREGQLEVERDRFLDSPMVIVECGPEPARPVTFVTANVERELGYGPHEFRTGRGYLALVHPDDRELAAAPFDPVDDAGASHAVREYRLRRADGSYLNVRDRYAPIYGAGNAVVGHRHYLVAAATQHRARSRKSAGDRAT
jgi:PAS domain S-box-containing protein